VQDGKEGRVEVFSERVAQADGAVARVLPTVSAKECAGYFRHAGYASI
jgi:hypothetical protein